MSKLNPSCSIVYRQKRKISDNEKTILKNETEKKKYKKVIINKIESEIVNEILKNEKKQ